MLTLDFQIGLKKYFEPDPINCDGPFNYRFKESYITDDLLEADR